MTADQQRMLEACLFLALGNLFLTLVIVLMLLTRN